MIFTVEKEQDGILLRTFLKNNALLSRKEVSRLKSVSGMRVNGEAVTVRCVLRLGDTVELDLEDKVPSEKIKPVDLPLCIIYEDNDILAVDKPPFMPVHPSFGHYEDTLANAVAFYYRGTPMVFRAVNRLDRNTSGIVLLAKNRRSAALLSKEMKERKIIKKYLALVEGTPPEKGIIEGYICREGESVIKRKVCLKTDIGAEYAKTEYERITAGEYSLLSVTPHTGRTHQIRVHLSWLGYPVAGDEMYGNHPLERHMLHSHSLTFVHPTSGEEITLKSHFPPKEWYR